MRQFAHSRRGSVRCAPRNAGPIFITVSEMSELPCTPNSGTGVRVFVSVTSLVNSKVSSFLWIPKMSAGIILLLQLIISLFRCRVIMARIIARFDVCIQQSPIITYLKLSIHIITLTYFLVVILSFLYLNLEHKR